MPQPTVKTRTQLEDEGVLLVGPIVPEWFKLQSDGCSVPTGFLKRFLKAEQTRACCYIHDYGYYIAEILYPHNSNHRRYMLHDADVGLRWNRTLIGKGWFRGQVFGRLYYRGVRIGGRKAANKDIDELAVPPSKVDLLYIRQDCMKNNQGELTERAVNILNRWEKGMINV